MCKALRTVWPTERAPSLLLLLGKLHVSRLLDVLPTALSTCLHGTGPCPAHYRWLPLDSRTSYTGAQPGTATVTRGECITPVRVLLLQWLGGSVLLGERTFHKDGWPLTP